VTAFLFAAAFLGGALNAVAGGGSFIALPALLYAGVPAVAANATNTLALWPGSAASVWAYRREIAGSTRWLAALGGVSLAGGLLGGALLVRTSNAAFLKLLPWLLLVAALTFTFGGRVSARLSRSRGRAPQWTLALVPQLAVATYGGFFPGGMGIMTLAVLSAAGMTNLHEMNGVKACLAVIISGVAIAEIIMRDVIAWTPGLVMVAGAIAGGYAGATLARRVDERYVRAFVAVIAWSMTIYFFVRPARP
jgi:uncharacterized membrane protein YfcA